MVFLPFSFEWMDSNLQLCLVVWAWCTVSLKCGGESQFLLSLSLIHDSQCVRTCMCVFMAVCLLSCLHAFSHPCDSPLNELQFSYFFQAAEGRNKHPFQHFHPLLLEMDTGYLASLTWIIFSRYLWNGLHFSFGPKATFCLDILPEKEKKLLINHPMWNAAVITL